MIKKCKNCNKEFETNRSTKQHCSLECFSEYRKRPDIIKQSKEKRKKSNLQKYGVDNPSKSQSIKEKIKQTCLSKYGVVSPTLVGDIRKKQIKTNLKKYGVKNPQQNEKIKQKQQNSLFKNYGVNTPLKNESLKEKVKQTCLLKYGVKNVSQHDLIKEKIKKTCILKYGVESPTLNKTVRKKQIKTCLENFGVKYPQQNKNIKLKTIINHKKTYYKKLLFTNRLNQLVIPLFSEEEYIQSPHGKNLKFQCKKCSNIFQDSLKHGNIPRCNICFPIEKSNIQKELVEYIKTIYSDSVIENDRNILNKIELDIFIPSKKIAIEFNGNYWHSELGGRKYKYYHINKTKKCEKLGIRLIHIFEDEWIYKQNIVKEKLKNLLQLNKDKIYARNCEIKEIDSNTESDFLENNHIQGKDNAPIRIGAYYNGNIVAVMSFGQTRLSLGYRSKKHGEYEMYRFCVGKKSVVGIASKMLSYFIKKYNPNKIISYADRRYSDKSAFYLKLGFQFIKETSPNYWYVDVKNYLNRIHRFNFRKQNLSKILSNFDPSLTEWENMQLNGYDRIWDCGNLKYEWIKS